MASTDEILSKLETAVVETETTESPTGVASTEVAASADDKTDTGAKGKGAQDRIRELVVRAQAAETKFEDAVKRLQAKEAEVGKLIDVVQDREGDARAIQKINELHKNPKYRDLVETLDKAINGIEVEAAKVEQPAVTPVVGNDALTKVQQEVAALRAQASAAIQDQKTDLLLAKSDVVLKELFNQLPGAEYLSKDKALLEEMLTERIDWQGIEDDPKQLESKVTQGFQRAIEEYGDPRGRIATQAASKNTGTRDAKAKAADFTKTDVGKLVQDGKQQRPAISDD